MVSIMFHPSLFGHTSSFDHFFNWVVPPTWIIAKNNPQLYASMLRIHLHFLGHCYSRKIFSLKLVSSFLSSHMMFRVNTHLSFSNPPVATIPIVPVSLVSQVFWTPKHRLNKLPGVQTPLKQGIWRIVSKIRY